MSHNNPLSHEEIQIRSLLDDWVKAIHVKDLERVLSRCSPGMVSFDVTPSYKHVGLDRAREFIHELFVSFDGDLAYEIRDLDVTAGSEVAFCHGLHRLEGKKRGGGQSEMWFRSTLCFRKVEGHWLITHEHVSIPGEIDVE
ncbi:YybH family protein [Chondromyces crocatus]|uniref:SnoaL-like domain-containing protein n=1 Tax=Chondromyces crocatus TaxID=52 RepID=A0A0K1ET16_CHOCO|nr:nuclear transport factor 2 family protein [Chondromyces crocatus]AKT43768.1 uncharacterized protein CMC5_080040 [Chondromyces crocatus]